MKTILVLLVSLILLLQVSVAMAASAGLTTPGSNTYPNFLPHRVSGFEFSGGNDPFSTGAPDLANGYAYMGVEEISGPPQIYKIQLGFGNMPTSRVAALKLSTGETPRKILVDPVHGYAYLVTSATPAKIIKLALNPGDAAPTRVSDLTLLAGDVCANAAIDPIAGYLYVTTNGTPGRIVKVQLGTGNAAPVRVGSLDLNASENNLQAAAIDTAAGVLYVGTLTSPGSVVKVALGVGSALPTRLGATALSLNKVNSAVIDAASGYLYVTTNDSNAGSFIKMALKPGAQPPEERSSLDLQGLGATGSVIDTSSGHAYVHASSGFFTNQLFKIQLNAGDAAPTSTFANGNQISCDFLSFVGFVDATSGYVYVLSKASLSSPIGTLQKIATGGIASGMSEVDFRQFNLRQDLTRSIGFDASKSHLYALTANSSKSLIRTTSGAGNSPPAFLQSTVTPNSNNVSMGLYNFATGYAFVAHTDNIVVKFNISSGITSVSSVGGVMPSDFPRGGVIDTVNNFAYYWNGNASSDISKLELGSTNAAPVARGSVNIGGGGVPISSGVVDGSRLKGYFASFTSPSTIYVINLGSGTNAPTLGTSLVLDSGENQPTCAIIDTANNHAYFGTNTTPGKIVKLDLSTDPPTRLGALTLEAGEGPLRTATIDTANKVAYFSTGQDPAQVIKIALGNGSAVPVRIGSLTLEAGESPTSADFDTATGYAYLLSASSPGRISKIATAVAGRLKATRMVLTENATVNDMRFYSHTASGKLRLAIYDNSSPKQLVWQSAEIVNTTTAGEITATIASGAPSQLILNPGTYWLAWQSETVLPVPSFTPGSFGDGFYLDKSFGSFDSTLGDETVSDERWTQYINFTSRPTFVISGSDTQVAGASQNITITARNAANTTLTSYTGVKSIAFSGANASTNPVTQPQVNSLAFNTPINVTFTNGVATIPLRLFKVETAVITCTDPALNATTGTSLSVTVTPQAVQHFRLGGPASTPVGSSFSLDLTAEDNYGNLVSSYSGSHSLTFGGPGSSSAPVTVPQIAGGNVGTVRSVNFTSGQASVSATLYKAETVAVAVSEGAVVQFPAYTITAQPGVLSKFGLSGNATQVAGTAQNVSVFALDTFGNTATSSNGPLNVTFSGAAASANGSQPTGNGQNFGTSIPLVFINGVVSAPIVLVKDEVALVAAVSGAINTPSALSVDVQPANAAALTLSTSVGTQFQNQSLTYTVAAFDSFGNAALGYTGTLAFTSSDPLAVLPANITFNTSNSASVTLRTVGNQAVNVTDTLIAALTATRIITVNTATPTSITASQGTPQSTTVGTAFTTPLRATVRDSLSQPIAGASVVFSTPSTGSSGSFDGATTVITDGNGVASAPGFNANTLPGTYNLTAGVNALTATFALTNTVGAPVSITASAGSNQNTIVGAAFATALAATVRDQFNNPISGVNVTFAVPGTGASGTFASSAIVATNSSGVATAPALTANNTPDTFTATATAGVLQAMYTLTSLNDVPVAQTQNLNVLEGNPLAITLTATDLTSGTPTFTLVTTPQHGTLTGTAPNYTYTPDANFTGPDSFNFKANDGLLDSSIVSIFITVQTNNAKPVISTISQSAGTLNQTPFTITVSGTNFVSGAVVTWNGQALTTAFVSSTQVTASVTAQQLASAGNIPVAVQNPVPQLATSNSLSYFLYSGAVGTWIVTNTNDTGQGSLRLALASARNGDAITFDPVVFDLVNSDAETLINVLSELPALDDGNVSLDASDRRVSINGAAASSARGLVIDSDTNTIRGLSILGFERSGISIRPGAANNVIGGSRTTGSGPNGQGLRISGNGTYGVEILGAGATGNVVKGCWIGLDASGAGAQPNLAGIIIGEGATANTIGSTTAAEENVVSGNALEGITVAGAGTDDNIVIGNSIGATAAALASRSASSREGIPGRSAVGNGSAGLFLSKGTKNTKNGGTEAGEGNSVAFNGGNGIEVRSPSARRNSARGNRVTANSRGGIALFDGSNDGVKAPVVDSFQRIPTRNSGAQTRTAISARVKGTVTGNGAIELFNDSGDQGAVLVGRAAASGAFEVEIDIDDLLNLTATFTDENGNTSPFGFFGRATGNGAESPDDADGDGFSNSVETLAGTDPQNAALAPVSGGALAVDATKIGLNFASSNKDSLAATVRVALPAGVTLPQSTVGLMFGGVMKSFLLDAKLRSPKAVSTLKAASSDSGAIFKFALRNEDLKAGLNASGLANTTTAKAGDSKSVAVVLTLKSAAGTSYAYAGVVNLVYKATQGKTGKASIAK